MGQRDVNPRGGEACGGGSHLCRGLTSPLRCPFPGRAARSHGFRLGHPRHGHLRPADDVQHDAPHRLLYGVGFRRGHHGHAVLPEYSVSVGCMGLSWRNTSSPSSGFYMKVLGFKGQEEDRVLLPPPRTAACFHLALLVLTLCLFSPPQSRCGCGSGECGECGAAGQPL